MEFWIGADEAGDWLGGEWEDPEVDAGEWRRRVREQWDNSP